MQDINSATDSKTQKKLYQIEKNLDFEYLAGQIDFYDKFSEKNVKVEVEIYSPVKNALENGHLIMIVNGTAVPAKEYSLLSKKLANVGYFVVTANYQTVLPHFEGKISAPSLNVLHTLLKNLVLAKKNQDNDSKLPKLNFKDVIILGHSMGGYFAIIDISGQKDKNYEKLKDYLPDQKNDEVWEEYVKGVVAFEGWLSENVLLPKNKQFLIFTASQYRKQLLRKMKGSLKDEENEDVGFYVFENSNHYLINNFQGQKQVVEGCHVMPNQEDFITSFEEWSKTQDEFVKLLDLELQKRLDNNQQAQILLSQLLEQKIGVEKL